MSVVIILGASQDCHALHMLQTCHKSGIEAALFDTSLYPSCHSISWNPVLAKGGLRLNSTFYKFEQINSVFWSSVGPPSLAEDTNPSLYQIAMSDSSSALRTFFDERSIRWVNSWQVFDSHKVKPRQLHKAATSGALIPQTYIGNETEDILSFAKQYKKLLFKPVYGGSHATLVDEKQLNSEHLQKVLKYAPVTIQQYIEGTNIRTYVIGSEVFSAEIVSDEVDFRLHSNPIHIPTKTPIKVARLAKRLTQAFKMHWTAIDWRRDNQGNYYFLEANPSPMFMHFEQITGYPITEMLVQALIQPRFLSNVG
ncbi:RimK family alpha-L-glutamate ligase [Aliiglaciecola sp. SL4]|uniref:ATP-grasp domain-containing protein n=1 Tax=Aliiglaciecola sp. SL4 TaxID=3239806 RepID=UPI00355B65AA